MLQGKETRWHTGAVREWWGRRLKAGPVLDSIRSVWQWKVAHGKAARQSIYKWLAGSVTPRQWQQLPHNSRKVALKVAGGQTRYGRARSAWRGEKEGWKCI